MNNAETTTDEIAGMAWWNGMNEQDRQFWLACAESAVPADAWKCYKLVRDEAA